jgi:hypothetical protein
MSMKYFACPAHRCKAPGRFFLTEADALAYAEEAAVAYCVAYSIWAVHYGKWTHRARFGPYGDRSVLDPPIADGPADPDPTRYREGDR